MTDPPTLLDGDAASQWRFVLESILADALRVVRTAATDDGPAGPHDVERALDLVRRISIELRALPCEEPIPF